MWKKYSKREVIDMIEQEGLEYLILYYLNPNDIEDEELRQSFVEAKKWLDKITDSLEIAF